MRIASIGIDLGRTTFHLVALGEHNKILRRKKFSHLQLLAYIAKLPSRLIGLEACAESHFLGAKNGIMLFLLGPIALLCRRKPGLLRPE